MIYDLRCKFGEAGKEGVGNADLGKTTLLQAVDNQWRSRPVKVGQGVHIYDLRLTIFDLGNSGRRKARKRTRDGLHQIPINPETSIGATCGRIYQDWNTPKNKENQT